MLRLKKTSWELIIPCLFWTFYASVFIYQSSVVVNNTRYFTLFDDAMISMAYANNLLDGYGLNWARFGDPVEGYTNPLWTFMMVPVNMIPIDPSAKSLVVQIIGLVMVGMLMVQSGKLFRQLVPSALPGAIFILLMSIATFYPLMYWSLLGMETCLQALIIIYCLRKSIQIVSNQNQFDQTGKSFKSLFAVLSIALFLRYDMIFLVIICMIYILPVILKNIRPTLFGLLIIGIPNLAYFIFRILYFHDILPNTYYLKMSGIDVGLRIQRGWLSFIHDFRTLFIIMGIVLVWLIWKRDKKFFLLASVMLVYWMYAIYVGGDGWDFTPILGNRFTSIVYPVLIVLVVLTIQSVLSRLNINRVIKFSVVMSSGVTLWLCSNQLPLNNLNDYLWKKVLLQTPQMQVKYHQAKIENTIFINTITKKEDVVAVVWAGIPAYFGKFRLTDVLGYNHYAIAHQPSKVKMNNPKDYLPGHMKWDDEITYRQVHPKIVMELWTNNEPEFAAEFGYEPFEYPGYPGMRYWVTKN